MPAERIPFREMVDPATTQQDKRPDPALSVDDLLGLYMQPAVVALAERIESDLLGLYSQFHGELASQKRGSTELSRAGIPQSGT